MCLSENESVCLIENGESLGFTVRMGVVYI